MNMATSSFSVSKLPPCSKLGPPKTTSSSNFKLNNYYYNSCSAYHTRKKVFPAASIIKCDSSSSKDESPKKTHSKLGIGSPIVVVEAPKTVKTAASIPCLRINHGLINPGDVGRIVSRKPKDVWAIRLSIGTYLIDGKYFKPLELDQ
ncbi:protein CHLORORESPIRATORY REDUCTION 42, chloroplastic isoform X2 [Humulus lupulus]|uniref:protein CHLORORESPIRATORY REDUCTION 42, chloroplastic isoform X2 n=1 Tax=Humulus lupulus TaxID=3486 RepID=UPI002B40BA25|nr:protein CHLORORESPIRATORY REDUCTION 42, chloroplastic isoform X2 [Humulus lupulus]